MHTLSRGLAVVFFSFMVSIAACDIDAGGELNPGFELINTYNDCTRLTLLYNSNVSGDVTYIETQDDLGITDENEFNASIAAKTIKTVTADNNRYDDYITTGSYGSLKALHVYVLYKGWVWSLTGTTSTNAGASSVTGTVTGSTTMDTTITLPAGYNDDT